MEYDFKKIESLLIHSVKNNIELDNFTALKAFNIFQNHYNTVSLQQLYFGEIREKAHYPDGDISVSVNDIFDYSEDITGKPKHRNLKFQRNFYGYFDDEVVELRLNMFYKPVSFMSNDRESFYYRNEKIQEINNYEWFAQIKNDTPINYTLDVNFNA